MKMKRFTGALLILALPITFISCQKFLENDITTEIDLVNFGKTPAEVSTLLTQAYVQLRDNDIIGQRFYQRFTNDFEIPPGGTSLAQSNIAKMNYDAGDGEIQNIWNVTFSAVSRANLVIQKTTAALEGTGVTPSDAAQFQRLEGEARFLRAFLYFNLARLYRNVPIVDKFFNNFEDINLVSNGATDKMFEQEQKVYEFMIDDLTKASTLLPQTNDRGRPGSLSAKGMLGKVLVTWGSILKHREAKGPATEVYTAAIAELQAVISSGKYALKPYYPDNFIRDKQYAGANEFLFAVEFNELDNSGFRVGDGTGFVFNSSSNVQFGQSAGANGAKNANDFGWSVYDYDSPGDLVRRFWSWEEANFVDINVDGGGINNGSPACPNTGACEVFLRSREPYQFTRPYWYETVNSPNSFRYNPAGVDVATAPNGKTYFTIIWGDNAANALPGVSFAKYRRNPMTQATYTGGNFDGDMPILRYSEILLLYAEAANELGGPAAAPPGATLTALQAVNQVRDRARNFVYYPDISVNTQVHPGGVYNRTLGDIYKRAAKIGTNPPLTDNAADTIAKYYYDISAFKGIREVPPTPTIRNFKQFTQTANYVADFAATLSQTDFREKLLDERWRELSGELNQRWFDLVRYGRLVSRIVEYRNKLNPLTNRTLATTNMGTAVLQIPDKKFEYLPIPLAETQRNPKLNQNVGF